MSKRVLIVEDDPFISLDVEQALLAAGYEVCGSAANATEAMSIADHTHPDFAVVDVNLAPGDGRSVARELIDRYDTAVLMATGQCEEQAMLAQSHARVCLPKPYDVHQIPTGLETAAALQSGHEPIAMPYGLILLH